MKYEDFKKELDNIILLLRGVPKTRTTTNESGDLESLRRKAIIKLAKEGNLIFENAK